MSSTGFSSILRTQDGLVRRDQVLAAGISPRSLHCRLRAGGPWRRVLPGVYATHTGTLTPHQRRRAALLYGGPAALLGGPTAAVDHGLRNVSPTDAVHLLLPMAVHRAEVGFVVVRRTIRFPSWSVQIANLPVAPLPRAVIDTCLELPDLRGCRALIAEAVQRKRTTVECLAEELAQTCSAGSAFPREVLEEVADGVRSAPEAENRALILRSAILPRPLFNCRLYGPDGRWLADPDVYWEDAGLAEEIDSVEWHRSPERWAATMDRHARMVAAGLQVVHYPPSRLLGGGYEMLDELERAYLAARRTGPAPGIRAVSRRIQLR